MEITNLSSFRQFAQGQVSIGDTDPHVQVITRVSNTLNLTTEERLWYGILYMAYYQDGSAWAAFSDPEVRSRSKAPPSHFPISYQRRNLFGGRLIGHFESVYSIPSLTDYFDTTHWSVLVDRLKQIQGNGRWAGYTTAELLAKIALPEVKPDTSEIVDSSGPKQGLEFLGYESPTDTTLLELNTSLVEDGVVIELEKLESAVCNWSRMMKSDFYLGHNLDRQHDRIVRVEREYGADMSVLWNARKEAFDHEFLAELNHVWGRTAAVDKDRKKHFMRTGEVLMPREGR